MNKMNEALEEIKEAQEKARKQVEAIVKDGGKITMPDGTTYNVNTPDFLKARKVFSFLSSNNHKISNMAFLDMPQFEEIEAILGAHITHNDCAVGAGIESIWSTKPQHQCNYVNVLLLAMQVISYPFTCGGTTA